MAITFVANALGGTTTTTSFSITFPAGIQTGDLLILEFNHQGLGHGTFGGTGGTGWALKHSRIYGPGSPQDFSGKLYWKFATGDDAGSPSPVVTVSNLVGSCAGILTVYCGAGSLGSPDDPLGDAELVSEQNASGNETQAQISNTTAGAWVVLTVANQPDQDVSSGACTDPGALVERAEVLSTGGSDTSISHWSAEKTTVGGTGAFTWTQTNTPGGSWAYAITPAPLDARAADLSVTLGAATLSGATAVAVAGALSSTLGAATLSGAAAVAVAGALSSTLGAATLSGAAAVEVAGALSSTLGAVTLSADVAVSDGPAASLAATLGAATLSGAAAVAVTCDLSATLGAVTLSADATATQPAAEVTATATASAGQPAKRRRARKKPAYAVYDLAPRQREPAPEPEPQPEPLPGITLNADIRLGAVVLVAAAVVSGESYQQRRHRRTLAILLN